MQVAGIAAGSKMPEMKPLRQNNSEENSLQKQIEAKQQELEQLSENKEMDPKQKLEKKKELEAEIADLNNQLQQKRTERLQGKESEKTESASGQTRKRDGFSSEESDRMNSLLSADRSVKEAAELNSASDKLKGKARVLRTEAKLDAGRGISGEEKLTQASGLEHRADRLKNESAKTLGSVRKAEKAEEAEETKEAEKEEKTEKDGEDVRIGDVTYTSDGRLVEASEEKEPELDERA